MAKSLIPKGTSGTVIAEKQLFQAATYPSLLALAKPAATGPRKNPVRVVVHRREARLQWEMEHAEMRLGHDLTGPWLLVPPQVRAAFDRVSDAGRPLAVSRFGPPRLGVKTGCNAGFLVRVASCGSTLAEVCSGERHGWVEHYMLRPALRGERFEHRRDFLFAQARLLGDFADDLRLARRLR